MKFSSTTTRLAPGRAALFMALTCIGALTLEAHAAITFTKLHEFSGTTGGASVVGGGGRPLATPVYNPLDGRLYGTTANRGAANGTGIVYSLNPANPSAGIDWKAANSGYASWLNLMRDGATFYAVSNSGPNTLYSFTAASLSASPATTAITTISGGSSFRSIGTAGADGTLYLLNAEGGNTPQLYARTSAGLTTQLWGSTRTDATEYILTGVHASIDGYVYFVAAPGYDFVNFDKLNDGGIFRLKPSDPVGTFERLAEFSSATGYPVSTSNVPSSLVDGGDGWLYGSTYTAAAISPVTPLAGKRGSIYRVSKTKDSGGAYPIEVLHTFTGGADGEAAYGAIALAKDGNVYGTTREGGANNLGTLWRIVVADAGKASKGYELLHSFAATDGQNPTGVSVGAEGFTLFGVAEIGGVSTNATGSGTVFKVDLSKPATVVSFAASAASVQEKTPVNLTWATEDATACAAGGDNAGAWTGAKPTSGSNVPTGVLTKLGTNTFMLSCTGADGLAIEATTLTVSVTAVPSTPTTPTPTVPTTPSTGGGGGGGGPVSGWLLLPLAGLAGLALRRRAQRS